MKTLRPEPLARRALAGTLAFLIAFGPIAPMAAYAATPLADAPINVNIKAKPNVVLTLDDSTSMQLDFLPDYVVVNSLTNALTNYCRSATGLGACGSAGSATMPQYTFANWGMPTAAAPPVGTPPSVAPWPTNYGSSSYGPPAVMTSSFNAMFYNPAVTYTAPLKYDGTSYNDMTAGNTTNWTKVPADPYLFPAKFVNLQTKVSVGVWCNTDYADKTNNGDGTNISSDHCRINGYPYAAGSNGAPAVKGDYNYPYARNAAGPALANFFSNNTKVVWCDPTKMNSSSDSESCQACAKVCPEPLVDSPAGCDPGCTNPSECTVCTKKCPVATVTPDDCGSKTCGSISCTTGQKAVCTTGAPITACSTVISRAASPSFGKTYDQDANSNGDVCRRNNFTYGAEVAGGWTYNTGHAVYKRQSGSCGAITSYTINRHYYKAAVQWCNAQISTGGATANDKWRGYGKGTCQAEKTATFKFPKFVKYGSDLAASNDNYDPNPAFELVELDFKNSKIIVSNGTPANDITHTLEDGSTVTRDVSSNKPETSELVNYANWFAYYRTRMLAAKTVTSLAFSDLTDKFRVGFHTLSNVPNTTFLTVEDFKGGSGAQRDLWYQKLVGVNVPQGNDTPLLDGITRIGDWFMASTGTHGDLNGSKDPITLSCQKNYHIMFTDGYTNQPAKPSTLVANTDGSKIPAKSDDTMPESIIDLIPGTDWPLKIKEGATAVDDSLADYALYYWMKDLRPPTAPAKVSDNNVPSTENDPAKWQHMNFAALSLGTEGVLPSVDTKKVEDQIAAGTIKWTTPTPNVYRPGVTGVDDLWHAAITGRSQFVNARDPQQLQSGMASILAEIKNLQAARAGVAFSSVNFGASDNYIYRVTIEPGWGGTLTKVLVDPKGGGEVSIGTKYHDVLAAQVTPATAGDEPWYDKRRIVSWSTVQKKAVPFRQDKIDAAQAATLGSTAAEQKKVIDYLRGDRSNEGTALKNYRVRSQILGDIVASSPVVVSAPNAPYQEATDAGYDAFKTANAGRKKMIYVGANDGMLHAFDEATGEEAWAYVPSFAYDATVDKGLKMLTKKEPFFKHQMFVDSTPVAVDVKVGGAWKTMLIGGLGKGGKGYYAIDITDPASMTDEDKVGGKVLWEFTHANMGYSYGKPLVAKTYKHGWVVIVTSGYQNPKKGRIFVLSLADGSVLEEIETDVDETAESGLAQIAGFVLTYKNQYLEQIYGGDLLGNFWRFDVSSTDTSKWKPVKFAEFTSPDPAGSPQSVTIAPQIEVDLANGVDRYVMIGTGRLLHDDDLVTYGDQVQTMYVIRDGTALKMGTTGLPHKPQTDAGFDVLTDLVNGLDKLSVKGWYHNLDKGERIIAPIAAELNLLGYAGSLPPENECLPGLAANIYVREFTTGESQLVDDVSGDPVASIYEQYGAVGMEFVNLYNDTDSTPDLALGVTRGSDGKTSYYRPKSPPIGADHRMSWRLLGN